jgi:hypothetical protein
LKSQVAELPVYRLGGLRIVSEFPLDGLQVCRDEIAAADRVVIRHVAIPGGLASATATLRRNGQYHGTYNGRDLLVDIPAAGRFLVRGGKEILIDLAPSSDHNEVRAWLLGIAFGLLCHQRGITPLHASAVDVAGGCVAFVGESGDGKSTVVAALAQRGYPVICDDVCFLQVGINEDVQAWPGISRIRLCEDAKEALGYDGPGIERELHGDNKYCVPVTQPQNPTHPRRLLRVYQLDPTPSGAVKVTRLRGSAAIEVLMQNIYALRGAEHMGYKPHAFTVCAAAARDVQVFCFSRPFGFDALGHSIDLLEKHLYLKT